MSHTEGYANSISPKNLLSLQSLHEIKCDIFHTCTSKLHLYYVWLLFNSHQKDLLALYITVIETRNCYLWHLILRYVPYYTVLDPGAQMAFSVLRARRRIHKCGLVYCCHNMYFEPSMNPFWMASCMPRSHNIAIL